MPTENEPGMPTKGEWHVALAEMVQGTCLACEHGNCVAVRAVATFLRSTKLREAMRTQEAVKWLQEHALEISRIELDRSQLQEEGEPDEWFWWIKHVTIPGPYGPDKLFSAVSLAEVVDALRARLHPEGKD